MASVPDPGRWSGLRQSSRPRPGSAELPTGTVTFLFTDIEGSTRLLQELATGMRPSGTIMLRSCATRSRRAAA